MEKLALGGEQDAAGAGDDAAGAAETQPGAARSTKRRRTLQTEIREAWHQLRADAETIERQVRLRTSILTSSRPRAFYASCVSCTCVPTHVRHQLQRGAEGSSAPVFAFVEGALVTALRQGTWILLDEVNLAPTETLERLAGVLEARSVRDLGVGAQPLPARAARFLGCGTSLLPGSGLFRAMLGGRRA